MKLKNFMRGRYGFDTLFFALIALCLLIVLLCRVFLYKISFLSVQGITGVTVLIMITAFYRVFSRNIAKRQRENIKFTLWLNKLTKNKGAFGGSGKVSYKPKKMSAKSADKGSVRSSGSCVKCGAALPMPDSSGLHMVICPKCKSRNFIEK